ELVPGVDGRGSGTVADLRACSVLLRADGFVLHVREHPEGAALLDRWDRPSRGAVRELAIKEREGIVASARARGEAHRDVQCLHVLFRGKPNMPGEIVEDPERQSTIPHVAYRKEAL